MDIIKDLWKTLHEHFGWFIWALVALAIGWFFMGGANTDTAHEGAYLKPLAPLDSGEAYGTYYAGSPRTAKESLNLPESPADLVRKTESAIASLLALSKQAAAVHELSLSSNGLSFDGVAGARATDPQSEYIRIIASSKAKDPIALSGLRLSGQIIDGIVIPGGISLPPGGRAIISSGVSPVGASFQVNMCTGYFAERGTFIPALRMDCPDGSSCKTNTAKGYTYDACVASYSRDGGFYSNEWRIFLGQKKELWKNSNEIIQLVGEDGKTIDALSY